MVCRPGFAILTAASLVAALSWGPPAHAQEVDLECGADVAASVTLTHDLECSGRPITVVADGVTIDLGGHTVTYDNADICYWPAALRCSVDFDQRGGAIRNGVLRGAGPSNSIAAYGPQPDQPAHGIGGLLIENVVVEEGDVTLVSEAQTPNQGNQLSHSIVRGGRVWVAGAYNTVNDSWVVKGSGIILDHRPAWLVGTTITRNVVGLNDSDGLSLGMFPYGPNDVTGEISSNVFFSNAGAGIKIARYLQNLGEVAIKDNLLIGNGGSGIEIRGTYGGFAYAGGPVTLSGNISVGNGGSGIDAPWIPSGPSGIVDGGNNVAAANAADPQCIGVDCVSAS